MPPLERNELIDDRALEKAGEDRFRHADFSVELADVVTSVAAPANIALFAPWGSGKSGLANLLCAELEHKPGWGRKLRFARFDAFKYAEAPLRRNFIAEMARQLGVMDEEYASGLYRTTAENKLKMDKQELRRLVKAFLLALLLVLSLAFVILGLIAVVSIGSTAENMNRLLAKYVVGALPVAALVTGFVALVTKGLTVTATRAAPSTEEEFEDRFRRLLKKVNAERIVIFVDELDRCAPDEVASTLETIKTFLEAENCVFVVAADHQVLEQALRKRVRQETPHDVANPYYSAGSSYLDKVFQFQLALPQLKPRRLTNFALELVRDRPGVWSRIDGIDDVVSVLMPTHITSPRRVKVLLNSFAITYRLAERRAGDGVLGDNLVRRATEVARLVCLRCEFPLFAEELHYDVRLLDVLERVGDMELDNPTVDDDRIKSMRDEHAFPEALIDRALDYIRGERAVAELLAKDDAEEGVEEDGQRTQDVRRAHAQQLIRYLRKTAHVEGSRSDLVHLEGSAVGLSLDPADAEVLERAAVDNDHRTVITLVERLENERRPDALRLLAHCVSEAFPGLEGDNVTETLLRATASFPASVPPVLNTVVAAVNQHQRAAGLRPTSYAGALVLARMRGGVDGARLREQVLSHSDALDTGAVRVELLVVAEDLTASQREYLSSAVVRMMLDDPSSLVENLERISSQGLLHAVEVAKAELLDAINDHYAASSALAKDEKDESLDDAEKAELRSSVYELKPDESLGLVVDALHEHSRHGEAEQLVAIALATERLELRNMVEARLESIRPISGGGGLVAPFLEAMRHRSAGRWSRWLSALPEDHELTAQEVGLGSRLLQRLWSLTTGDDPPADEALGDALTALATAGCGLSRDTSAALISDYGSGVSTTAEAQVQDAVWQLAWRFVDAGVADSSAVANGIVEACADTLRTEQATPTPQGIATLGQAAAEQTTAKEHAAIASHLAGSLHKSLPAASLGPVKDLCAALADPLVWLASSTHTRMRFEAELRRASLGGAAPSADWIAGVLEEGVADIDQLIAEWFRMVEPPVADARVVMNVLEHKSPTGRFAQALREYSAHLTPQERFELLEPVLVAPLDTRANTEFLKAAGFGDIDSRRVVPALVDAYAKATNDDQRRKVLKLWQTYGPTGDTTRTKLVDAIWLPLAESGPTGLRTALDHFLLVSPAPRGKQRQLVRRLRAIKVQNDDLARMLDRRLLEAGWIKKGRFGRRSEAPEQDSQ